MKNSGSSDWIVAVFADATRAAAIRVELTGAGIATDRLDVITWGEPGRAAVVPATDREDALRKHFATLFEGSADAGGGVGELVGAVKSGAGCVVVHPRGRLEIRDARRIIDAHKPQLQYLNLAPPQEQGGLLGEHAAGG